MLSTGAKNGMVLIKSVCLYSMPDSCLTVPNLFVLSLLSVTIKFLYFSCGKVYVFSFTFFFFFQRWRYPAEVITV